MSSSALRRSRPSVEELGDRQLVMLARGHDDGDAYAELWRRHFDRVRRSAPGPESFRNDILTDTFLGAVRSFPERVAHPRLTFGIWWRNRVRWAATRAFARDKSTWEAATDTLPEASTVDVYPSEMRQGIREALASLTDRQRRIFLGAYVNGHTVAEVSEAEGISAEAVRALMMRARRTFREAYEASSDRTGVF